jgi:hypothetical protein
MIVMGAVADPITPVANVMRIYGRAGDDGHAIVNQGGPHVIFGWGESCPDEAIGEYLASGAELPPIMSCEGSVTDGYVPVAADRPEDYESAVELMGTMDDQILNTHEYYERYEGESLTTGCDWGGTLTYAPTDTGTELTLDGCEFTDGLGLTGTGAIDDETGGLTLDVTTPVGGLTYERDGEGEQTVSGTFRGEPAS